MTTGSRSVNYFDVIRLVVYVVKRRWADGKICLSMVSNDVDRMKLRKDFCGLKESIVNLKHLVSHII